MTFCFLMIQCLVEVFLFASYRGSRDYGSSVETEHVFPELMMRDEALSL